MGKQTFISNDKNLVPNLLSILTLSLCITLYCGYGSIVAAEVAAQRRKFQRKLQRLLAVQTGKNGRPIFVRTTAARSRSAAPDALFILWSELALDTTAINHTPSSSAKRGRASPFGDNSAS